MAQLPSDTVYKDLKQKGLELTAGTKIQVADPSPKKVGIVRKLSSMIGRKKQQPVTYKMLVFQISNTAFLAVKGHCVYLYKYNYDEAQKNIDVQAIGTVLLAHDVEEIYTCQHSYIQDRDFPIIIKFAEGLGYLNYDLKEYTLTQRNFIKLNNVIGIGWISDKECLVMDEKNIYHYVVQQSILKLKSTLDLNLRVDEIQCIKRTWIMGRIDDQQDSTVVIFYATIPKEQNINQHHPRMKLKVKQFTRTLDGDIIDALKPDFVVETKNLEYRDKFTIISVGDYYCLQLASEILILRKKFDKYMLLDNMVEVMNGFEIKLNKKGLIVSIGQKLLQLSCIHFSDPKCTSRILDVIEFPTDLAPYSKHFKQVWPITNPKEYTLVFVFINESEIVISGLIKLQPMQKMMSLAQRNPKQKLQIIQDMALNLGIAKKDFYLKLWAKSTKENVHIYQYLIPCNDVHSIKKQLKSTLRTRTIQVSQMLKILQKITQINLANLKKDLNEKNLKQYVKNDFLRRKIKLNQMDKMLDHRIFENIYSSSLLGIFFDIVSQELDPVEPKFDPLHSNINFQAYKELKSLENVFQQFKVIILEDYKTFLRQFLSRFPKKITDVISRFNFLLPNYPFDIEVQKPSKTNQPILVDPNPNGTLQQLWFQTVTVSQWQAEVTKQRILKELFNDYPTSKITETIDQFYNSIYGKENKRWKHGLITASLDQYTKKLKTLNGIQLYLNVCEFANQLSVQNNGDPDISRKILEILQEKNKLTEPDMHYCKLYSSMHYFMLKNNIMPKNKLQISTLTSLKPENLVAIFFLQNKRRKQHIFADFKDLYEDKNEFRGVLQKFVQSENCSRIQLEMLMNQMITKGSKFQQQNQDLIELLITGICQKVEIRQCLLILDSDEEDEENGGGCLIDEILLNKDLALKVNRVKLLKKCKSIFKSFNLQRMTYKELLDLEKDNQIFKLVLSKYFQLRDDQTREGEFQVLIEGEIINLDNPRNLLAVLIYLQETVYYSAVPMDMLLIFGLELIQWKEFEVMRDLVNDKQALDALNVEKNILLENLLIRALQVIYLDPEIVYDDETKDQIMSILSIDNLLSPLKIRQIAKLDLVDIFTGWGLQVFPSDIHTVCELWKNHDRLEFMIDLIDKYIDNLDFQHFQHIYRLLEVTDKETNDINYLNKEYVTFCDFYAKKLLEKRRYKEVIEIIVFLMGIEDVQIDYAMLVESYLQTIIILFSEDEEKGRRFIQFFVQKYDTPQEYSIKQLLESYFEEAVMALWERSPTILINYRYYFEESTKMTCEIRLDDLWEMSKNQAQNPAQLFYNYFFLTMGLSNPKKGFAQTVGISYNLQKITNLLMGQLDNLFQKDENLWFVDYGLLEAKFLFEGMLGEAGHSLQINLDKDRKSKFDMILKELRVRRFENERNDKILNILTKLKAEIFNKSKRSMKKQRFRAKLKEINEKQMLNKKQQAPAQPETTQKAQPQIYLTWKKVEEDKRALSSLSQFIMSQKDLIDQVYTSNLQQAQLEQPDKKEKPKKPNLFDGLFLANKGIQKVGYVQELIRNKRYQEAGNCSANVVVEAIESLFQTEPERDYAQVVDILESLNMGDPYKKPLLRLTKFFAQNMPNQMKKQLFSLEFLMQPLPHGEQEEKFPHIYRELRPHIQEIVKRITIPELKALAFFMENALESNEYSAKIYLQALLFIGEHGAFDSNTVLMAQECIDGMGNYPEIVSQYYDEILRKMTFDKEMRPYVRQNLAKLMIEKHYDEVADQIKHFHCQ